MSDWMRHLTDHHAAMRAAHPHDQLLVVLVFDGGVLPDSDAMAVIRWFQIQPSTSVALTTGRPESLRDDAMAALAALGRRHRVQFPPDLVHMNAAGRDADVAASKVAGLRAFAASGYRTIAVFDDEPEAIRALTAADGRSEILFLPARTLYGWRRPPLLDPSTPDNRYDLRTLIDEGDLPDHVELVWHGVNDRANLRQFVASRVRWGEGDVRRDPRGGLALRHDSFAPVPADGGAGPLLAEELLQAAGAGGKGVKLDVKERGSLEDLVALVRASAVAGADLWFNGRIDVLGKEGFRLLRATWPDAIVQCPVDSLTPLVLTEPDRARERLDALATWGVDRFSLAWDPTRTATLLDRFDAWGHDVNLYAVQALDDFLRAVLLLPRSVTADFNFPEWHYFGRGAGRGGRYHRYHLAAAPVAADVA